jgi:hypothetical protein
MGELRQKLFSYHVVPTRQKWSQQNVPDKKNRITCSKPFWAYKQTPPRCKKVSLRLTYMHNVENT